MFSDRCSVVGSYFHFESTRIYFLPKVVLSKREAYMTEEFEYKGKRSLSSLCSRSQESGVGVFPRTVSCNQSLSGRLLSTDRTHLASGATRPKKLLTVCRRPLSDSQRGKIKSRRETDEL